MPSLTLTLRIAIGRAWAVLAGCALVAALAACAARTPRGLQQRRSTGSFFEDHWSRTCGARGLVGQCPASAKPSFGFDLTGESESLSNERTCLAYAPQVVRQLRQSIGAQRDALRACFGDAARGAWIEVPVDSEGAPGGSPDLAGDAVACAARVVRAALAGAPAGETPTGGAILVSIGSPLNGPGRGSLSKRGIRGVVASRIHEVRRCYLAALQPWPKLEGRTAVEFLIAPDGSVPIVTTAETTLHNRALECCINTAVKGFRFERPEGGGFVSVVYPFVLEQSP